jgi:hypothetical protein
MSRKISSNSIAFRPQANYTDFGSQRRAKIVPTFADAFIATDPYGC